MKHPAYERLPKKLSICFTLWAIFDTPGENACYHDLDKLVREHVERGFNCIRIDDGAGLVHDLEGNRRPPFVMTDIFGEYEKVLRQQDCLGNGGACDLLERLKELCRCCKKHGVYLILSSWYFLHTYWYHAAGDPLCDELFAIPPHERYMAWAKFLHYILLELEQEGLDDVIAFSEIFNEANGLPFVNGYGAKNGLTDEELTMFRAEHEEAIAWVRKHHPKQLFAYDSYTAWDDGKQMPLNQDVYNFHTYYMWDIYDRVLEKHPEMQTHTVTEEMVRATRAGRLPAADDWYERVALYNDLDRAKTAELEEYLEQQLEQDFDEYLKNVDEALGNVRSIMAAHPEVPIVCGEGVSYICSRHILWEEKSERYWELVERAMEKFKEFGLWGSIIRTCCGPEDPCWEMCADRLRYLNEKFLAD